jgi:hypothetical protein
MSGCQLKFQPTYLPHKFIDLCPIVNPEKSKTLPREVWEAYKQFETSGVTYVTTREESKVGKYLVNGKIMIVKNGKTYNLSGQAE